MLSLRLQRSVPGRGLQFTVRRQPESIESSVPWTGEQNATFKGTQEYVWAHRRSKAPQLGKVR